MLQDRRTAEARWRGRVAARAPLAPSMFPGNPVAVIFRPGRSAMTSGKARSNCWKLRFAPQSPPFVEPLMGWTGSEDTLSQVELTFPTAEAAVGYARRQGLRYDLRGAEAPQPSATRQPLDLADAEIALPARVSLPAGGAHNAAA